MVCTTRFLLSVFAAPRSPTRPAKWLATQRPRRGLLGARGDAPQELLRYQTFAPFDARCRDCVVTMGDLTPEPILLQLKPQTRHLSHGATR